MELRKSFDLRKILVGIYFGFVLVFLVVGFMPAEAFTHYDIVGNVTIPAIGLDAEITKVSLDDGKLATPERIVGSYQRHRNKTMLIGHASTVFSGLSKLKLGDLIGYMGKEYEVTDAMIYEKTEIDMHELLKSETVETLVLMTCAGEDLGAGDATHRLIVTARAL